MKYLTLFIVLCFYTKNSHAQNQQNIYFEDNNLRISQELVACRNNANGIHKQYIFLQVENLSDKYIDVFYRKELWYNDRCNNCENNSTEHYVKLSLSPYETTKGTCNNRIKSLSIFSKMLDNASSTGLTKFELKDLQINIKE